MSPSNEGPVGYAPPDGGWGWAVVAGAFISIGFSCALGKSISVFYKEIEDTFNTSTSEVSWISSMMFAVMYGGGPISSILVNKYGSRPVIIVGGCLSGCGLIAASFCNTVQELYLCIGVIGGLGLAFNLNPALTVIGKYFYKRRPLANGLAMAGSPVLLSALAPLNQALFDMFGCRGSFLILGGCLLNCCVAGALMRPIGSKPNNTGKDRCKKSFQKTGKSDAKKGAGRLNDMYGDYKYTYWASGVILIIAGIYLFVGMGINYRLEAKEQKAEEKQKKESKEEQPKEVTEAAGSRGCSM
ncbi:monocarboxylate transporter 1-like isoform X2 [Lemur catta]|uniref:monocarboxylate transporter 1-like isoform X2 n=1 Tax=Lemur catta TaxID=9447 RepID=UPI001E26BDDF|nr:monocarboxylate transporter 1-like isoform X2 [Lemur catta]